MDSPQPKLEFCPFVTSSVLIYSCFHIVFIALLLIFIFFQDSKFFKFCLMICRAAIESQNPWMVWAGRNLRDHLVSALLPWGCCTNMCLRIVSSSLSRAEHLPLDQIAQSLTQLGPEHCQGWDIRSFLGQTDSLTILCVKTVCLCPA